MLHGEHGEKSKMRADDPNLKGVIAQLPGRCEAYVLASWLYYCSKDAAHQSPWDDKDFDGNMSFMMYWRDHLPADFARRINDRGGNLKTAAHALDWTPAEISKAKWWASGQSPTHWPGEMVHTEPVSAPADDDGLW